MGSGAFIANNPMSSEGPETDQGDEDGLLTQPSTNEDPFDRLKLQEPYDVLDSSNRWCEGEITKLDKIQRIAFVSYLHWDSKFDEWVPVVRFAPLHAHTFFEGGILKCGQRIDTLDECENWLEAFILEEDSRQVKIHYKGYHNKFDCWIDRQSSRIRPFRRIKNKGRGVKKDTQRQWKIPGSKYPKPNGSPMNPGPSGSVNSNMDDQEERKRKIEEFSEQFHKYKQALQRQNLYVVPVDGDGNCLFRSVAHQVYGNDSCHMLIREKCIDYMESQSDFFCQFVEGGQDSFPYYLQAKRMDACWGDDPEIEALCELYNRPAEIWAFDPLEGAKRLRTFHDAYSSSTATGPVLRLSYYGGGHYDSIIEYDPEYPAQSIMDSSQRPGVVEDLCIALSKSRRSSQRGLEPGDADSSPVFDQVETTATIQRSDHEATEQEALEHARQESRKYGSYIMNDYDDLETCLQLSMQSAYEELNRSSKELSLSEQTKPSVAEHSFPKSITFSDRDYAARDSAPGQAQQRVDAKGVQEEGYSQGMIDTIKAQSEREYYEKEIQSTVMTESSSQQLSLSEDRGTRAAIEESHQQADERLLIEQVKEASRKEYLSQLSELTEEEAFELVMRQSMIPLHSTSTVASSVPPPSSRPGASSTSSSSFPASESASASSLTLAGASQEGCTSSNQMEATQADGKDEDEDALLQQALAASLQGYESSTHHAPYLSSSSQQYFPAHPDPPPLYSGLNEDEEDEDLVRAIEESLRK